MSPERLHHDRPSGECLRPPDRPPPARTATKRPATKRKATKRPSPSRPRVSDESLMEAYVGGESAAFDALFERYARPLVKMLRDRGAHEEDAREIVQQSFLQLHRARDRYQPGRPVRAWLLTITFNLWRDDLRRARRWRERPLVGEVAAAPEPDRLGRERDVYRVRRALSSLPPRQRSLLELHWFDELTYPEIAERCGLSAGAVKLRAFRAHAALRELLVA